MTALRVLLLGICALCLSSCAKSEASPGLRIPHPDDAARQVEYFIEEPAGQRPWPTIVLLHGHQPVSRRGGRDFVEWGVLKKLASRGYLAVAVSQPGYGNSTGPADFSGAWTQHAVSGVIAKLRAEGSSAPDRLLIEGISRGALTAGLVAARDPSVSGIVLISGVYDLPAYVAQSQGSFKKAMIVRAMMAETDGTTEALNARSVLRVASSIKAASLILNGATDERTIPSQASSLAEQIARSGGAARAIIYPAVGHQIPVVMRDQDIDPFIDSVLGNARGK